jgi:hypothetical protein
MGRAGFVLQSRFEKELSSNRATARIVLADGSHGHNLRQIFANALGGLTSGCGLALRLPWCGFGVGEGCEYEVYPNPSRRGTTTADIPPQGFTEYSRPLHRTYTFVEIELCPAGRCSGIVAQATDCI